MPNNNLTKADIQKENFKMALGVFLRTILSAVLCFFVYMSLSVLFNGFFTHDIGYQIYETTSDGSVALIEEHYYADDSSAPSSTPQAAGPGTPANPGQEEKTESTTETTLGPGQRKQAIRSTMSAGAEIALNVLSSIMMLLLLAAFPYSIVWSKGDRDKNSVNFGHMQEDKLRGLKVGLMAAIPSAIGYIVLVLSKLGVCFSKYIFLYRFANVPFMPIINSMVSTEIQNTAQVPWPAILAMLMVVAFVPLVCHFAYFLGYKQISLSEKFIYINPNKKKKRRRW